MKQVAASLAHALALITTLPTNAKGRKQQMQEAHQFVEQALHFLQDECALREDEIGNALASVKCALESLENLK